MGTTPGVTAALARFRRSPLAGFLRPEPIAVSYYPKRVYRDKCKLPRVATTSIFYAESTQYQPVLGHFSDNGNPRFMQPRGLFSSLLRWVRVREFSDGSEMLRGRLREGARNNGSACRTAAGWSRLIACSGHALTKGFLANLSDGFMIGIGFGADGHSVRSC